MALLACAVPAQALTWLYAAEAPWMYNQDDGQWYYLASFTGAPVGLFGSGSNVIEVSPTQGFAPDFMGGRSILVQADIGSSTFELGTDGRYVETAEGEILTGSYYYAKTGNNTGLLNLLSDEAGGLVVINLTFTEPANGSFSGRATDLGGTQEVFGSFTVN